MTRAAVGVVVVALCGCTAPAAPDAGTTTPPAVAPPAVVDCAGDDDALTNEGWSGFCGDHVDDNCALDVDPATCPSVPGDVLCDTRDEPCPATQPAHAPPAWACEGAPPDDVVAWARYADAADPVVVELCAYVYESAALPGEHYAAVKVVDGPAPFDPDRACATNRGPRRHVFFADLDAPCDGIVVDADVPIAQQPLSNRCRKMIRNLGRDDPTFDPDVQFFAADADEARAKLAVLDTVEVACVGVEAGTFGGAAPWVVQARAPLVRVD